MKNRSKFFRTVIVLFVPLFLFGSFTACNKSSGEPYYIKSDDTEITDGKHDLDSTETDKNIIENGASEYKIIISEKAEENVQFAAEELQYFLQLVSSVKLPIVKIGEIEYDTSKRYLCVGENAVSQAAGIEYSYSELDVSGTRIVTKNDSVFIGGATEYGTMNAVYVFLEQTIGLVTYTTDVYEYQQEKTVKLYDFDITDLPDFQWRIGGYGYLNGSLMRRMRYNSMADMWMGPGSYFHNSFRYLPVNEYFSDYPEWYSDDRLQLCYTAHGDAEKLEAMYSEMFEKLKQVIIDNPSATIISITHEDANEWCTCETCAKEKEKYGTNSAVMLKFCNEMSRRLEVWLADNDDGVDGKRKIDILFFAYRPTEKAPTKENADGTFSPVDEEVVCRENVIVFYAPIFVEYTKSFTDETNLQYAKNMQAWKAVSSRQYYWLYSTNFHNYLYPYNNFDVIQTNYRYLKSLNAYYVFDQGQFSNNKATAFHDLKAFLSSKLMWNVNEDVEKLTNDYFNAVYGDAAEEMKTLYNEIRTHMHYLEDVIHISGDIYFPISNSKYFSFLKLMHWQDLLDSAYSSIEYLNETDQEKYNRYYDNICLESIFVRYALIEHYSMYFSEYTLREMQQTFINDVARLSVKQYREGQPIDAITSKWGL